MDNRLEPFLDRRGFDIRRSDADLFPAEAALPPRGGRRKWEVAARVLLLTESMRE